VRKGIVGLTVPLVAIGTVFGGMSGYAFADTDVRGSVEGITAGGTVNGDTVEYQSVNLSYSPANPSVGRYFDGYWIGVKITSPTPDSAYTAENIQNIKYSNDGGTNWKSLYANKDGVNADGSIWMGAWGYVNQGMLDVDGGNYSYQWLMDWDNDGAADQTLSFHVSGVTLAEHDQDDHTTHPYITYWKQRLGFDASDNNPFVLEKMEDRYLVPGTSDTYYKACIIDGAPSNDPNLVFKVAEIPTATNHTYDGTEKVGVPESEAYTLTGDAKATDADSYTATATLADGYSFWADGTTGAKNIDWRIDPAVISEVNFTIEEPKAGKTVDEINNTLNIDRDGVLIGDIYWYEWSDERGDYGYDDNENFTGIFEAGKKYFVEIEFATDDNHYLADDFKAKLNGVQLGSQDGFWDAWARDEDIDWSTMTDNLDMYYVDGGYLYHVVEIPVEETTTVVATQEGSADTPNTGVATSTDSSVKSNNALMAAMAAGVTTMAGAFVVLKKRTRK
jgi:hypothetical protein